VCVCVCDLFYLLFIRYKRMGVIGGIMIIQSMAANIKSVFC